MQRTTVQKRKTRQYSDMTEMEQQDGGDRADVKVELNAKPDNI